MTDLLLKKHLPLEALLVLEDHLDLVLNQADKLVENNLLLVVKNKHNSLKDLQVKNHRDKEMMAHKSKL